MSRITIVDQTNHPTPSSGELSLYSREGNLWMANSSGPRSLASGGAYKRAVRAATTGNITLSGEQTIDGVSCVAGDSVLVKNQSTASQNGIYVVQTGAWARRNDANTNEDMVPGHLVPVLSGTTQGGTVWMLVTTGVINLGTTSLSYSIIGSAAKFTSYPYFVLREPFISGGYGSANQQGFLRANGWDGGGVGDRAPYPSWAGTHDTRYQGSLEMYLASATANFSVSTGLFGGNTMRLPSPSHGVLRIKWVIRLRHLSTSSDRYRVRLGFADTAESITNIVQLTYRDDENSGRWWARCISAGVATNQDTGVTAATGVWYHAEVEATSSQARFYLDTSPDSRTLVATISTNLPTTGLEGRISGTMFTMAGMGTNVAIDDCELSFLPV